MSANTLPLLSTTPIVLATWSFSLLPVQPYVGFFFGLA